VYVLDFPWTAWNESDRERKMHHQHWWQIMSIVDTAKK
jgi:hypothetical protein